jgi:hypothetical protein
LRVTAGGAGRIDAQTPQHLHHHDVGTDPPFIAMGLLDGEILLQQLAAA